MNELRNIIEPTPIAPIIEGPWFVIKTVPQQDLPTVPRLHELGLELFVPVLRIRVKTGRIGKNGHKVTRIIAKSMFQGYGFLRNIADNGIKSAMHIDAAEDDLIKNRVRGVMDYLRDIEGKPVKLPHIAIVAVKMIETGEHQKWLQTTGGRRGSQWKAGDRVRIDHDGGAYAGLVATVEWANTKGNIGVLLGMIKTTLPAEMVVAA